MLQVEGILENTGGVDCPCSDAASYLSLVIFNPRLKLYLVLRLSGSCPSVFQK